MSLRRLPLGAFMYLIGGMLFGFGVGFGSSTVPSITAVVITGLGSFGIVAGYFLLRPLMQHARTELARRKDDLAEPVAAELP